MTILFQMFSIHHYEFTIQCYNAIAIIIYWPVYSVLQSYFDKTPILYKTFPIYVHM